MIEHHSILPLWKKTDNELQQPRLGPHCQHSFDSTQFSVRLIKKMWQTTSRKCSWLLFFGSLLAAILLRAGMNANLNEKNEIVFSSLKKWLKYVVPWNFQSRRSIHGICKSCLLSSKPSILTRLRSIVSRLQCIFLSLPRRVPRVVLHVQILNLFFVTFTHFSGSSKPSNTARPW